MTQKTKLLPRRLTLKKIKSLASKIVAIEPVSFQEIGITLVTDAQIAQIHEDFMKIAGPTDVITFPLGDVAEIVVSVETCQRQAKEFDNPFEQELLLYIVHGILHLAGYDDHTPKQIARMRKRESEVMAKLGMT